MSWLFTVSLFVLVWCSCEYSVIVASLCDFRGNIVSLCDFPVILVSILSFCCVLIALLSWHCWVTIVSLACCECRTVDVALQSPCSVLVQSRWRHFCVTFVSFLGHFHVIFVVSLCAFLCTVCVCVYLCVFQCFLSVSSPIFVDFCSFFCFTSVYFPFHRLCVSRSPVLLLIFPSLWQVTGFFKEFFELMGEHMTDLGDKEAEEKAKAERETHSAGELCFFLLFWFILHSTWRHVYIFLCFCSFYIQFCYQILNDRLGTCERCWNTDRYCYWSRVDDCKNGVLDVGCCVTFARRVVLHCLEFVSLL